MASKGRKSKYETHVQPYLEKIKTYCRQGLVEADICKKLGVSVAAFANYKNDNVELIEALKEGKKVANDLVESSLFKRAIGYKYTEVTRERSECLELVPAVMKDGEVISEAVTLKTFPMLITKKVTKHLPPDTAAAFIWLKNRVRDRWQDRRQIDLTNPDPFDGMTAEELDKAYEEITGKIDAFESQAAGDTPK